MGGVQVWRRGRCQPAFAVMHASCRAAQRSLIRRRPPHHSQSTPSHRSERLSSPSHSSVFRLISAALRRPHAPSQCLSAAPDIDTHSHRAVPRDTHSPSFPCAQCLLSTSSVSPGYSRSHSATSGAAAWHPLRRRRHHYEDGLPTVRVPPCWPRPHNAARHAHAGHVPHAHLLGVLGRALRQP